VVAGDGGARRWASREQEGASMHVEETKWEEDSSACPCAVIRLLTHVGRWLVRVWWHWQNGGGHSRDREPCPSARQGVFSA
jgi:hypothetical protein